jgi:DNA-binding NtrC family response regulator
MESELFGHVKGAFSSATSDSRGLLRSAEGGTLFLDEINALPLSTQPQLLRALLEKEVRGVGSSHVYHVDVRIVAATNQDLESAVTAGRFSQDLFFTLNSARIEVPPLRSVKDDIPLIAMHCVRRLNRQFGRNVRHIAAGAMSALMAYDFPGNVLELENIIERAYACGADDEIRLSDLPALSPATPASTPTSAACRTVEDFERGLVVEMLRAHSNDKAKAAAALGMSERTLYRRLKKHRLTAQ